jgi:hypothetical protein
MIILTNNFHNATQTIAGQPLTHAAAVDTNAYPPHSILDAYVITAIHPGLSDIDIKSYANWSRYLIAFDDYYFKLSEQNYDGAMVVSVAVYLTDEKCTKSSLSTSSTKAGVV